MTQLKKLQHTFQNCVLKPDMTASTSWVSASGKATPETQLSIYSYAYRARLNEVLSNDYPAIHMAIGDESFYQLTKLYIAAHPSHYFSLRDFGAHLPDFVSGLIQQPNAENTQWQEMPWLYELALFEWNLGQAFDAADVKLLTEQDMGNVPHESWPDIKFTLHPSVQQLNFEWNIVQMWQALTYENPTEITASNEEASSWLIWREQLITRFRSMEMDEQLAFESLRKGEDFNDICESLIIVMNEEDIPMHVAGLLKSWITQGLITKINM
jgi:hypothetical protein